MIAMVLENKSSACSRNLPAAEDSFKRLEQISRQIDEREVFTAEALIAADIGVFEWDLQRDRIKADKLAQDFLGIGPGNYPAQLILNRVTDPESDEVRAQITRALKTHEMFQIHVQIQRDFRADMFLMIRGRVRYDSRSEPCTLYGIILEACVDCIYRQCGNQESEKT